MAARVRPSYYLRKLRAVAFLCCVALAALFMLRQLVSYLLSWSGHPIGRTIAASTSASGLRPPPCNLGSSSEPVRVACLGDSLTRGDGSHETPPPRRPKMMAGRGNYPAMLQSLLGSATRFDVRNFGRGGATACERSNLPYAGAAEFRAAVQFRPHVVVLMLGTNDAKAEHWERPPCGGDDGGGPSLHSGIRTLLDGLVSNGTAPAVLLVPPPPVLSERWGIQPRLLPPVRASLRTLGSAAGQCGRIQRGPGGWDEGTIMLAPDLPIPTDRSVFVNDEIHLSRHGSAMLACSVFMQLVERCGDAWERCGGEQSGQRSDWEQSQKQCEAALRSPSEAATIISVV